MIFLKTPLHKCPAHQQFKAVNLVRRKLTVSEEKLTFDDTANVKVIDDHALPCYFAMVSVHPHLTLLIHMFGLVMTSVQCLPSKIQDFVGRKTKTD